MRKPGKYEAAFLAKRGGAAESRGEAHRALGEAEFCVVCEDNHARELHAAKQQSRVATVPPPRVPSPPPPIPSVGPDPVDPVAPPPPAIPAASPGPVEPAVPPPPPTTKAGKQVLAFTSSNVKRAELEPATGVVTVTFANGSTYRYANFNAELMAEWDAAKSAGSWFHNRVKMRPEEHPLVLSTKTTE